MSTREPKLPALSVAHDLGLGERDVARFDMDASTLDFIIDNLPTDDGITKQLVKLRESAKEFLWDLEVQ